MQPFRALVADNLPEEQNSQGFAIQSLFIGLGGTIASALPWMMTNWFGVAADAGGNGHIPHSVRLSFYIGAAAFMGAVLWTVFSTTEYPPTEAELTDIRARKFDWTLGLGDIFALVFNLPAAHVGTRPGPIFHLDRHVFDVGLFFAGRREKYFSRRARLAGNGSLRRVVRLLFRRLQRRVLHLFLRAALGHEIHRPQADARPLPRRRRDWAWRRCRWPRTNISCCFAMTAVGIAWASILSMPYAMLAPALPKDKVGVMMGMFNLFIVLPQIAASSLLGFALKHFLHNEPMNALVLGGASMGLAALLTLLVVSFKKTGADPLPVTGGGGH